MAILNRRQELPRDRADLYDQASRVLLYHWDVDHKRLQLPMDAIGRRKKQEMLRAIAYEMQAGEDGLKGNLISAERLTQILTNYLRDQGFGEPREKANGLIDQLRHRNWILCDRGADTYGFVHRTFLEYFCAMEIVHRFEKVRSISFEELRDEVFGQHWQDETWHEVLRLICGAIDPKFAGELIEFLMSLDIPWSQPTKNSRAESLFSYSYMINEERINNLLLAIDCVAEIKNQQSINETSDRLLKIIQEEVDADFSSSYFLVEKAASKLTHAISRSWQKDAQILNWLQCCACRNGVLEGGSCISYCAVEAIAYYWQYNPDILLWLKTLATTSSAGVIARILAIEGIAKGWKEVPEIYPWLKSLTKSQDWAERSGSLQGLVIGWKNHADTLETLEIHVIEDPDWRVRGTVIRAFSEFYLDEPMTFDILSKVAINDPFQREDRGQFSPRQTALQAILTNYPTHPKTLELLRDRAINDPDEQLRQWAQKQLKMQV